MQEIQEISAMKLTDVQQFVLAIVSIGACLGSLFLVFVFGRRLTLSAQMREYLVEGAAKREYDVLLRDLRDRAWRGNLDPKFPPPAEFGEPRQLWDERYSPKYQEIWGPNPVAETQPSAEEKLKNTEALKTCQEWEKAERSRFETMRREIEAQARERAEKVVPRGVDMSLLGGGWSFLLEFSTVIVIIFALLVLGVVGQVDGKSTVTILASIAGYVLGKASSGSAKEDRKAQENGSNLANSQK
jgi:hypothetical protein